MRIGRLGEGEHPGCEDNCREHDPLLCPGENPADGPAYAGGECADQRVYILGADKFKDYLGDGHDAFMDNVHAAGYRALAVRVGKIAAGDGMVLTFAAVRARWLLLVRCCTEPTPSCAHCHRGRHHVRVPVRWPLPAQEGLQRHRQSDSAYAFVQVCTFVHMKKGRHMAADLSNASSTLLRCAA